MSVKLDVYNRLGYLWMPRADESGKIMPFMLPLYEERCWQAQIKKNGTATFVAVSPKKNFTWLTRHNEPHKLWSPTEIVEAPFRKLPEKWFVFYGEVLHSKTKDIKNTLYLYEMLVCRGKYLHDTTYRHRYSLMMKLFASQIESETDQYVRLNSNVWIAKNFDYGFSDIFTNLKNPEDEGLVLRDPEARLRMCDRESANTDWLVKCRKPTKNYGF